MGVSHSCFNLNFLDNVMWNIFSYDQMLFVYLLEMSVKIFGPFFIQIVFLLWSFKCSLYILDSNLLPDVSLKIFSSSLWLVFPFS